MTTQVYNSNGWDMIAATNQKSINAQLAKIPAISVNKTETFRLLGAQIQVTINIVLGAPQVAIKKGSGRDVDINFPVSGTITIPDNPINIPAGEIITVTTDLTQIEALVQSHAGQGMTDYDLILNLESPDAIVNMTLDIPAGDLAFLLKVLLQVVKKDIGNGNQYKLASFSLSDVQAQEYKVLLPYKADFTFVEDTTNADNSNLLVLMLTVSQTEGNRYFNGPLLPAGQNYAVLMSNQLFLASYVLPPLVDQLKSQAKSPDKVASQIELSLIDKEHFLYQVQNSSTIALNQAHDPWIQTINAGIDTAQQALLFYVDGKADITFLDIHVDAWDKSWHQFSIDAKENISLPQITEDQNKSTTLEWWKWLIAILLGPIWLIVVAIIYAVVEAKNPGLGGKFKDVGKNLVTWPNQDEVILKSIITPNHVVVFVDVNFH